MLAALAVLIIFTAGAALYCNSSAKKETNSSNASIDNKAGLNIQDEDAKEQAPEQGTGSSYPRNTPPAGSSESNTGSQQESPSGTSDPLRSRIEEKYIALLQSLASGYEVKLDNLMAAAVSQYQTARQADPNADVTGIINEYYRAGRALEAECDSQFYSILAEFESELSAHSFPLDMAVQAREAYEARKSARAGQILPGSP